MASPPRDYVFAYGLRNPFGGAWRASDGKHYEVENGPSVDRLAQMNRGVNYGWNNTDASMTINAIYNWTTAHAPVNMTFVQPQTFAGSQFPAGKMDHLFVSESGPTYASGPQTNGKRIVEFVLDGSGNRLSGPTTIAQYSGTGRGSVVALAAGPDGLYFSEFYEDSGAGGPTAAGSRIFRVRYVNPLAGDFNIDGTVNDADYTVWKNNFGSNLLLSADGNRNGLVDIGDYTIWRDALAVQAGSAASVAASTRELVAGVQGDVDNKQTSSLPLENSAPRRAGRPIEFDRFSRRTLPNRDQALLVAYTAFSRRQLASANTGAMPSLNEIDATDRRDDSPLPGIDACFTMLGDDI